MERSTGSRGEPGGIKDGCESSNPARQPSSVAWNIATGTYLSVPRNSTDRIFVRSILSLTPDRSVT